MKQRYYEAGPKAAKMLAWRLRRQQAENTSHRIREQIRSLVTRMVYRKHLKHIIEPSTPSHIDTQLLIF